MRESGYSRGQCEAIYKRLSEGASGWTAWHLEVQIWCVRSGFDSGNMWSVHHSMKTMQEVARMGAEAWVEMIERR